MIVTITVVIVIIILTPNIPITSRYCCKTLSSLNTRNHFFFLSTFFTRCETTYPSNKNLSPSSVLIDPSSRPFLWCLNHYSCLTSPVISPFTPPLPPYILPLTPSRPDTSGSCPVVSNLNFVLLPTLVPSLDYSLPTLLSYEALPIRPYSCPTEPESVQVCFSTVLQGFLDSIRLQTGTKPEVQHQNHRRNPSVLKRSPGLSDKNPE